MAQQQRILLVGFGNMGQALARGWLANGRPAASVRVVDPSDAAQSAAASLEIQASRDMASALAGFAPDVVLLAVKPNQLAAALGECARCPGAPVFLSIAAGKRIEQIAASLPPNAAVVRAMPNTPAAIGQGVTALAANAAASDGQRSLCAALLAAVGKVVWLDDERHMDAVTAVSGSGPAYVFLLIECLESAALEQGLSQDLAKELALATVAGAGAYAAAADAPPAELRKRVTSPGGTTQAALGVLMGEHGLRELMARAVRAATERSRELSAS